MGDPGGANRGWYSLRAAPLANVNFRAPITLPNNLKHFIGARGVSFRPAE
jgi:hypothetical protein